MEYLLSGRAVTKADPGSHKAGPSPLLLGVDLPTLTRDLKTHSYVFCFLIFVNCKPIKKTKTNPSLFRVGLYHQETGRWCVSSEPSVPMRGV